MHAKQTDTYNEEATPLQKTTEKRQKRDNCTEVQIIQCQILNLPKRGVWSSFVILSFVME